MFVGVIMQENKKSFKAVVQEFFPYIIIIIVVLLVKTFVVSPIRVNGRSMENTLHDRDIMLLNEITYRFSKIERFDIVVVHYQNEYLIKRVIGLPGDQVSYIDNSLYINGKKVNENYEHEITDDFSTSVIPKGKYFVLGDNRTNSTDSRMLGFFTRRQIKGKAAIVIYPFSRFGWKK